MQRHVAIAATFLLSGALALNTNILQTSSLAEDMLLVETPKGSLRASRSAKIPDVEENLELAKQWMTALASNLNATANGTAGVNQTLVMVVGVKDAPRYYDCGTAMNTAWSSMAQNPCSTQVWTDSDKMKEMVPECSKLRYGEKYTKSYRALKVDQDTWCNGPNCSPACLAGVECFRSHVFPFEPKCADSPLLSQKIEAEGDGALKLKSGFSLGGALKHLVIVLFLFLVLVGGVFLCKKSGVPVYRQPLTPSSSSPPPRQGIHTIG